MLSVVIVVKPELVEALVAGHPVVAYGGYVHAAAQPAVEQVQDVFGAVAEKGGLSND